MQVLIDSGAWSIFNQARKGGKAPKIGMPDYIAWLKANPKLYNAYVNFDVITSGQGSYDNWIEMRKQGLDPIAVYHVTTDVKFLKKYLDAGATYIAIGRIAFLGMRYRFLNCDNIWANYLTDPKGFPTLKVHGFGLTSLSVMTRYPWYSVDSSSWGFIARHGGLFIARKVNGVFDFTVEHYKRNVSTRAPHKKSIPHIQMMGRLEEKVLREYLDFIETPYGISSFRKHKAGDVLADNESLWKRKDGTTVVETVVERGVINCQQMRSEANVKFFVLTANTIPKYPWPFKAHSHRRTFI